ncbi:MAG: zinc ribbon domain-containing protein [Clostridia bacterium]|nr:zinc ribbon domain-containing protein [Clostridia bacterium]
MKNCINCSAEIDDNARFCEKCGSLQSESLPIEDATRTPETIAEEISEISQISAKKEKKFVFGILGFLKKYYKLLIVIVVLIAVIVGGKTIYDNTHCRYGGCNNANAEGSRYCYSHTCNICTSPKMVGSKYCAFHYYLYDDSVKTTTSNVSSDLKFSNIKIEHNSSYTVVTGTVTNNGTRTYKFVEIKGSFKKSSGTVVDTDSTYAVGGEGLAPGESKTFRMSVTKNYDIKKCDISIIDYD